MSEFEEIDLIFEEIDACSMINSCLECDNRDCPKHPDSIYYADEDLGWFYYD